jgi:hypothetical protein
MAVARCLSILDSFPIVARERHHGALSVQLGRGKGWQALENAALCLGSRVLEQGLGILSIQPTGKVGNTLPRRASEPKCQPVLREEAVAG